MSAHCGASLVVGVRMAINKCRSSSSFSSLLFLLVSFPPLSFLFSSLLAFPILSPLLSSPRFLSNLLRLLFLVSSVSSLLTPLFSPPLRSPRPSSGEQNLFLSRKISFAVRGGSPQESSWRATESGRACLETWSQGLEEASRGASKKVASR